MTTQGRASAGGCVIGACKLLCSHWTGILLNYDFDTLADLLQYGVQIASNLGLCHAQRHSVYDHNASSYSSSSASASRSIVGIPAANPAALFNLLPRMIEVGPRLFVSEEWTHRRDRLPKVV